MFYLPVFWTSLKYVATSYIINIKTNYDRRKIEESYSTFKKLDWLVLYIVKRESPRVIFSFCR